MNAENSLIVLDAFEGAEMGAMNARFLTQIISNFFTFLPSSAKFS